MERGVAVKLEPAIPSAWEQQDDVIVRAQKNGAGLFVKQIAGLGRVVSSPEQTVILNAGDVIDFAVGDGGNGQKSNIVRVSTSVNFIQSAVSTSEFAHTSIAAHYGAGKHARVLSKSSGRLVLDSQQGGNRNDGNEPPRILRRLHRLRMEP